MKKIILGILREIGIALVILIILVGAVVIAFKDKLPYEDVIPSGEQYVKADMKTYSVSSSDRVSEINAVTITHETSQKGILDAEADVRIQTGKYTPFGSISSTTDLPTEKVGSTVAIDSNNSSSSRNDQGSGNDDLEYPDVDDDLPEEDDMISQIERDQLEDSESAAQRRFNSVD